MTQEKEYFAFISYKREDEKWARWLQHKLEHYHLPVNVRKENPSLPQTIRPVFKDTSELAAGVLADEIHEALENSKYLIVICSPRAAQSQWVGKEVQTLIIPFVIGGTPFADHPEDECFPSALLNLPDEQELLGVNINEMGRDAAAIKVIARMFGLKFDTLWQRHEREQRKKRLLILVSVVLFALATLVIGGYIYHKNIELDKANASLASANKEIISQRDRANLEKDRANTEREKAEKANASLRIANDSIKRQNKLILSQQDSISLSVKRLQTSNRLLAEERDNLEKANWKMMENHLRFVAEKSTSLVDEDSYLASRLALESLPESLSNPNRPYTSEAEFLLRTACDGRKILFKSEGDFRDASFSSDGKFVVTASGRTAQVWDVKTGKNTKTFRHKYDVEYASFTPNGQQIVTVSRAYSTGYPVTIWNIETEDSVKVIIPISYSNSKPASISHSHDGKYLVTTLRDSTAIIWDIEARKIVKKTKFDTNVWVASWSPKGRYVVFGAANSTVLVWDVESDTIGKPLSGHKDYVKTASFSSDEKEIVTASLDGTARIWNVNTGECITQLKGHKANVNSASFSPNGQYVVTASSDGTAMIWNAKTGISVKTLKNVGTNYVRSASFAPDGRSVVTTFWNGLARIWDVSDLYDNSIVYPNGSIICVDTDSLKNILVTERSVSNVYFYNDQTKDTKLFYSGNTDNAKMSPDERSIIFSTYNDDIIEWDIRTNKLIRNYHGHKDAIYHLSFSHDGKYIISASADSTVRVWDTATDLNTEYKFQDRVRYADYSRDDRNIIVSVGNRIIIFDAKSMKELLSINGKHFGNPSLSSDGNYVSTASNDSIFVWSTETGTLKQCFVGDSGVSFRNVEFSPDGLHLLCDYIFNQVTDSCGFCIWDIENKRIERSFSFKDTGCHVAYSQDGSMVVAGCFNDAHLYTWDTKTWKKSRYFLSLSSDGFSCIRFTPNPSKKIIIGNMFSRGFVCSPFVYNFSNKKFLSEPSFNYRKAFISPDGKYLMTSMGGDSENSAQIWDIKTGKIIYQLESQKPLYARFSSNGKYIVTTADGKEPTIWDAKTGEKICVLNFNDRCFSFSVSHDSKLAITTSWKHPVILWNFETGDSLQSLVGHRGYFFSASFSPDDKYVVTASTDSTAIIWDVATGDTIHILRHKAAVNTASFSPDGNYVLSASNDNTANVWSVKTGGVVQSFNSMYATNALWSRDGKQIITWSEDGVRIWEFPPLQQLINETRERFKDRPLTPEERRKYYLE